MITEYLQNEENEINFLTGRLEEMKRKFFKTSNTMREIEFLEEYIKLKKAMVSKLQ